MLLLAVTVQLRAVNITTVIFNVFTSHLHQILPLIPHLHACSILSILSTFLSQIINISAPRNTFWSFQILKWNICALTVPPFYVFPVLPTWQLCMITTTRDKPPPELQQWLRPSCRAMMFLCGYRRPVPLLSTHEISFNLGSIGAAERRIFKYLWLETNILHLKLQSCVVVCELT